MADMEKSILDTIKKRKIGYFGHVLREQKYELIKMIIQGKIEDSHRGSGMRKMSRLRNIC